jgi:FkbM family methyltransferase
MTRWCVGSRRWDLTSPCCSCGESVRLPLTNTPGCARAHAYAKRGAQTWALVIIPSLTGGSRLGDLRSPRLIGSISLRDYLAAARSAARSAIRQLLRPTGFDLIRLYRLPRSTFLGLRHRSVRTIVDVGANRGQFAREALTLFPNARLVCFEPLPNAFGDLEQLATRVPNRITPVNAAVGESDGEVSMQVHVDWDYSSSLLATTRLAHQLYPLQQQQTSIQVPMTTLDSFFAAAAHPLEPEIVVKIDAQGYDDRVIRGGRSTFAKSCACIVEINLDHLYEGQASFKDITLLLDELGYRYAGNLDQTYAEDGHVVFIDAVFVR